MISKKDITQYVPKDNCLASWGGTDNYEFRFVPEAKRTPATPAEAAEAANAGEDDKKVSKWCIEKNCQGSKDNEYLRWEVYTHYVLHILDVFHILYVFHILCVLYIL